MQKIGHGFEREKGEYMGHFSGRKRREAWCTYNLKNGKIKSTDTVLTKASYLMINGKFQNLYSGYSALHIEGALKAKPGKVIKIHERNSGQSKNTVLLQIFSN